MDLTARERRVRKELEKIYPQLLINCRNTCGTGYDRWGDDLLALCIEMFLDKDINTQIKVIDDGKLENYLTFMMGLQLKSSSSRFYHHYRKPTEKIREFYPNSGYSGKNTDFQKPFEDEEDPLYTCLKNEKEKLDVFEKMVLDRHLINNEKYKDLADEYDIPYHQFKLATDRIRNKLKKECQQYL